MRILPTRILLATDASKDAEFATTTAVGLVSPTDSELYVFTTPTARFW